MVPQREARNAVERIRNDARALGKLPQHQAFRRDIRAEPAFDFPSRFGMQFQGHAQRRGCGLARVVVRRDADAAEAEHDVAGTEAAFEQTRQARPVVADIGAPRQFQTALPETRDDARKMLVLPLAGEDFVTDDDCAECHVVPIEKWDRQRAPGQGFSPRRRRNAPRQ